MNKKLLSSLVAAIAAAWGAGAQASMTFNFQNGQGDLPIGSWDWGVTTFVAQAGTQAVDNFAATGGACDTLSCDFTVYTHAVLVGASDPDGNPYDISGLNSDFEITVQYAFSETVTGLTGSPGGSGAQAEFAINQNAGEWLQVFYDTSTNTNAVAGFGFNDGTLILSGSQITSSNGLFSLSIDPVAQQVQFDQFPENNPASDSYGDGSGTLGQSQLTRSGEGSQGEFRFGGLTQDNTYFIDELATFGISFNNLSFALPVSQVQPSDCFADAPVAVAVGAAAAQPQKCANIHVDGLYSAQAADPNGGYLPVVGNVNGAPTGDEGGPDFVAQSDYNSAFTTAVPAPASLALLGIGLAGIGVVRQRRSA